MYPFVNNTIALHDEADEADEAERFIRADDGAAVSKLGVENGGL